MLSNDTKKEFVRAERLLYNPLKWKIKHWKNVRTKKNELEFFSIISEEKRSLVKLPQYNDWFTNINKTFIENKKI